MRVVRTERAVEVVSGTVIDLVVTRPVAVPSERQFTWPESPAIEGVAVHFLRTRIEVPPPDVNGRQGDG